MVMQHTVDEGVQDGHGAVGNTSVRVHLLQDWRAELVKFAHVGWNYEPTLVDVGTVSLLASLGALLLLARSGGLLASILLLRSLAGGGCLGGSSGLLVGGLRRHFVGNLFDEGLEKIGYSTWRCLYAMWQCVVAAS